MEELKVIYVCDFCGDKSDDEDFLIGVNESSICQYCLDDHYAYCEYSDSYEPNDTFTRAYRSTSSGRHEEVWVSEWALERYFSECTDGDYWHNDNVYHADNGDIVSPIQVEDGDYFHCSACGGLFHDSERNNHDWEAYCDGCYGEVEEEEVIHRHDYTPDLVFYGDSKMTFGVETEIDSTDYYMSDKKLPSAQRVLDSFDGLFYNKSDGSLTRGFEIVSHPATYEYLYSRKEDIKSLFDYLVKQGWRAHDTTTCGLHVHISRKQFKNLEAQTRFVYLFEKFYDLVLKFTRRTREGINQWAKRYDIYDEFDTPKSFHDKFDKWASITKYRIVNMCHTATLEIRAFRGTLNIDTWFASIQFVAVMAHIANQQETAIEKVTWQSIVKLAKAKGYKELQDYFVKRGLHDVDTTNDYQPKSKSKVYDVSIGDEFTINEGDHFYITHDREQTNYSHYFNFNQEVSVRDLNIHEIYTDEIYESRIGLVPLTTFEQLQLRERGGSNVQYIKLKHLAVKNTNGELIPLTQLRVSYQL